MMMNQGATTDTIATLDPNSLEKRQVVDSSQIYAHSYYATSGGSAAVSWATHTENGVLSNAGFHYDQHAEPPSKNVQDGLSVAAIASTSSLGAADVPQEYSYVPYQNTDPYGYSNTGYSGYYTGCQQQANQSYPQPVGSYQSTSAPYQPLSSFQNTGSYASPASYSSTYYNPGDYSSAPGTENMSITSTSSLGCPVPDAAGYVASNNQPPAPYTSSWMLQSSSSELPSVQEYVFGSVGMLNSTLCGVLVSMLQ